MGDAPELWLVTGDEVPSSFHEIGRVHPSIEKTDKAAAMTEDLLDSFVDGEKGVVAVAPEALASIVSQFFGERQPPVGGKADAGSLTRLLRFGGRTRLVTFNDTTALGRLPQAIADALEHCLPVVALIRHGRTAANVEGRWQGIFDDVLDEEGERQANALVGWYGTIESVWSSPLRRAAATATALHAVPSFHDDLVELRFGKWEGLTTNEIKSTGPLFDQIFGEGSDHPRGETGETWTLLERRMRRALDEIEPAAGRITGVVTHGAAIRAVITSLTEGGWVAASRLFTPRNTSVTHLVMSELPVVIDYGLAPHLEDS